LTVTIPDNTPLPGLAPIASVIGVAGAEVTVLPLASLSDTVTLGIELPAAVVDGPAENASRTAPEAPTTLNVELPIEPNVAFVAVSVQFDSWFAKVRLLNVATPDAVATVVVPPRPVLHAPESATTTLLFAADVTVLENAS